MFRLVRALCFAWFVYQTMVYDRTEEKRALERQAQRLSRIDGVARDDNERRHPSWGGSRGYDTFHREDAVDA